MGNKPSKDVVKPETVDTELIKEETNRKIINLIQPIEINIDLIQKMEEIKTTNDIKYLNKIIYSFIIELQNTIQHENAHLKLNNKLELFNKIFNKILECYKSLNLTNDEKIFTINQLIDKIKEKFKVLNDKRTEYREEILNEQNELNSRYIEPENNRSNADKFINNFLKESIDDLIKIKNEQDLKNFEKILNQNIENNIDIIKKNKNKDVDKIKLIPAMFQIVKKLTEKYRKLNVELPKEYIESGKIQETYLNNNNTVVPVEPVENQVEPVEQPEESVNIYSKFLSDKYIKPLYDDENYENIKNIGGKRKTRRNKKKSKKSRKNKNKKTTRRK